MHASASALLLSFLLQSPSAPSPADVRAKVEAWTDGNQRAIVAELADLLGIPNVAANRDDIVRNVEFLEKAFAQRGFTTRRLQTAGNPLFFAERRLAGAAERRTRGASTTTLIYAHVDGQPVDATKWKQDDPWTPVMRTGRLDAGGTDLEGWSERPVFEADWRLFARSASDDKSPIIALLAALDALAVSGIAPTSHLKVIIDTEEEAGSPSLDSAELMRVFGIAAPERAGRLLQEGLQEPTLNIRGLASAHVGAGARTIIPDRAVAALDLRLVKETSGARLMARIADHVRRQGFHLVDAEPTDAERAAHPKIARLEVGGETPAFRTSPLLPASRALASAMASAFGAPPVQIRTLGGRSRRSSTRSICPRCSCRSSTSTTISTRKTKTCGWVTSSRGFRSWPWR